MEKWAAMSPNTVLAKSAKGIEEVETRAHRLGARLRQALIRVDGAKSVGDLCEQAGEMGETLRAQLEELERDGYVESEATVADEPATEPFPMGDTVTSPVEFNSPVKFKLQDLLMDAVGGDTGRLGLALAQCRNRDDLALWVRQVIIPIESRAGKAKARTFEKAARALVG